MKGYYPTKPLENKVFLYGIRLLAGNLWAIFIVWAILTGLRRF